MVKKGKGKIDKGKAKKVWDVNLTDEEIMRRKSRSTAGVKPKSSLAPKGVGRRVLIDTKHVSKAAKQPPQPPFWRQPRGLGAIIGGVAALALIVAGVALIPDLFSGVSGNGLPVIKAYTVNPSSIAPGKDAVLSWKVKLGSKTGTVTIDHGVGDVQATGIKNVAPPVTTDFNLKACNQNGCVTAKATVTVAGETGYAAKEGLKIVYFTAEPKETAKPGDAAKLKYKVVEADNVLVREVGAAEPFYSGTWLSGTVWRYPQQTTTYEVIASKGKKTERAEATVWVKGSAGGESPFADSSEESGEQAASEVSLGGITGATQAAAPVINYFQPAPATQVVNGAGIPVLGYAIYRQGNYRANKPDRAVDPGLLPHTE